MKTRAWLVCLLLVLPVSAMAQSARVSAERMLDPLPDFDPFEPRVTAERYFPDELEQRVRLAILDALNHRTERLREHVRYFEGKDKERLDDGGNVSGLAHHVRELHHGNLSDREDVPRRAAEGARRSSARRPPAVDSRPAAPG